MSNGGRHATSSRNPFQLMSGVGDWAFTSLRSWGAALVTTALLLGAAAFLYGAFAIVSLQVTTHTVLTGSMRGTFDPGALLITAPKPVSQVKAGDVILFIPPGEDTPYAHRVKTVKIAGAQRVVTTQGDANPAPDRWKAVLEGDTVPHVVGHVPHLGRALLYLQTNNLRTGLLALLGLVVAVSGTRLILGSAPRDLTEPTHPRHKELQTCPSTPPPLSLPTSATLVPSPRPPSASAPSLSPELVSTQH